MHVDIAQTHLFDNDRLQDCESFVHGREIMIAGPRESKCPGIYRESLDFLERVFAS